MRFGKMSGLNLQDREKSARRFSEGSFPLNFCIRNHAVYDWTPHQDDPIPSSKALSL
jgi:hypothetical protein